MRSHAVLSSLAFALALLSPAAAAAGMFVGLEKDLIDPTRGEQATVVIGFDEKLKQAIVTVKGTQNGLEKKWTFSNVTPGKEYTLSWTQAEGQVDYTISVFMDRPYDEDYTDEAYVFVSASPPITASIPPDRVDMATRSFDLVTNHPPSHVVLEVMDDERRIIGKSTFKVQDAAAGKPVRVTWEQQSEGNIFKISAVAHDEFGYWAGVDIIPWSLVIEHEDVNFETAKHEILPEEMHKVETAWDEIVRVIEKYGDWVKCSLYVAGYTDTVGDASSNQGLSERRAMSLARYFLGRGATFPIWYQGFGESVLAEQTEDNVDMLANRRALYIITAGNPPYTTETPRAAWRRVQ